MLIEPCEVGINGVMVARVITDKVDSCPMRILNMNPLAVTLKANLILGEASVNIQGGKTTATINAVDFLNVKEEENDFNLEHLNNYDQNVVLELLDGYRDLFCKEDETLTGTNMVKHRMYNHRKRSTDCEVAVQNILLSAGSSTKRNRQVTKRRDYRAFWITLVCSGNYSKQEVTKW